MKHIIICGMLGLALASCNDTTNEVEYDAAEQDYTPTTEVNSQPMEMEDSTALTGDMTYSEHFDAALASLDADHASEAADHMQMGISALMSEGVNMEGTAHQEFKTVVEQLEDANSRLRAGEATDREQLQTLITQAEEMVQR
ncbi:hypothetical protein [Lewinella sp. IMCC34191]|uniref:hypothetical protein n=1 Tax=Lewinella sp. IMCC34191 TaxID=2259172 RepID=UPI0013009294|nr:hypothetical protein [Lewinella sp. IMCC34191]